ncbi:ABC transporter permease [Alteromonas lipolytica]|uniref:ABC transporter n=1 Tax=Alteromonas lipolytica TaxID=1856405 RepID=A0A1E8FAF6_9ALTE|nr:ABC transporter permease [Alteromonas lipolytica]OFI32588.1 ABC transporter [Alteromonas lipolytica]GGF74875.1 transport permease protein [Alteromonas lipolytica]
MSDVLKISLRSQLKVWNSVCFALFLRELRSQFDDKLGLTWGFVEPFIFIFGMSYARTFMGGDDVHGIPVFMFMLIGMVGVQTFLQAFPKVANAFSKNKPLYAFRQVQPIAGLLVSGFVEYTIKVIVVLLSVVTVYLLEIPVKIHDPLLLLILFHLLWIMTLSMSCLLGIAASYVQEIKKVVALFTRPLFFISCIFFSLQDIPKEYWHWLTWNPLVHFIELARYACYESYGDAGVSISYVIEFTVAVFFFAIACYHLTWKGLLSR